MSILDDIVAHKRVEVENLPTHAHVTPCTRHVAFAQKPFIIAEVKAASPSEGDIVTDSDPAAIARDYVAGGADAISVLTDTRFFKGGFDVLQSIRAAVDAPLLCKDFIIDERQVRHARTCGADMCLLIVKILPPERLSMLKRAIEDLSMQAVIEVQTADELETALAVDPKILLINNRNLSDFSVDAGTTAALLPDIPHDVRVITASGITDPAQVRTQPSRVDGVLVGTALMRAADKITFLKGCRP